MTKMIPNIMVAFGLTGRAVMAEAIITHHTVVDRNVFYVMKILYQGKQWTIQRRYSDFIKFDKKLISEGYVLGFVLPNKVVFGNLYPTVLEHRRKELNKYLRIVGGCLSSDNTYLKEFFEVDENMLKHALKKNRRLSDIYRSDNIHQIYKRASQQMINGRAMRQYHSNLRHAKIASSSSTSFSSSSSRRSGGSLSSHHGFNTIKHQKHSKTTPNTPPRPPPRSPPRNKGKIINNVNTFSSLQEDTRLHGSFSSHNDTLEDSLQEGSLTSALKDDFLALSNLIAQEEYNTSSSDVNTRRAPFFNDAFDQTHQHQHQSTYISNVNSCFRQQSDDGSWTETSSHAKVIDILSPPTHPTPYMTQMTTDMNDIAHLIQQHLSIPFSVENVITDPSEKWSTAFSSDAASRPPRTPRPPFHRPHSQESTIPLRLRLNKDDTGANLPPHLIKHLL